MHQLTAAHRTLPLGSVAEVRSLSTGRQVTVRINDRGPFARGRILDLSFAGAQAMGMIGRGTDDIELRVIRYQGKAGEFGVMRVQVGSFADPANARVLLDGCEGRYPGSRAAIGRSYLRAVAIGSMPVSSRRSLRPNRLRLS